MKCVGYTKSGPANTVWTCNSNNHKEKWKEGKETCFFLSAPSQLTYLVLCEGVGEGVGGCGWVWVGVGVGNGVWRQGGGGVQASMFRLLAMALQPMPLFQSVSLIQSYMVTDLL